MPVGESATKPTRVALVLSGGGMFGAWQAGAWAELAAQLQPDLIVGASVGSLVGYVIASGASPEDLRQMWLNPTFSRLRDLSSNIDRLVRHYQPRTEFAITATDLLCMETRVFRDGEITARHLAASCALPFVLPQVKIAGRWYSDGGLLRVLPLQAAVDLGATHIVALLALRDDTFPWWMRSLLKGFRALASPQPPQSAGVVVHLMKPSRRLGGLVAATKWDRARIEEWIALGQSDARAALVNAGADAAVKKTFPF